jgi:hypothetical protein
LSWPRPHPLSCASLRRAARLTVVAWMARRRVTDPIIKPLRLVPLLLAALTRWPRRNQQQAQRR